MNKTWTFDRMFSNFVLYKKKKKNQRKNIIIFCFKACVPTHVLDRWQNSEINVDIVTKILYVFKLNYVFNSLLVLHVYTLSATCKWSWSFVTYVLLLITSGTIQTRKLQVEVQSMMYSKYSSDSYSVIRMRHKTIVQMAGQIVEYWASLDLVHGFGLFNLLSYLR